jgi:hypothetical protein
MLACEVETLDVGENQAGTAGTGGTGGTSNPNGQSGGMGGSPIQPPPETPPRECDTDEALEEFVGVWEGVEENFTFEPIQPARLEIRGASASDVCGSFLYGELNAPPRATDPNVGYPPEPWGWNRPPRSVRLGFPYEVAGGARATTLRISISPFEIWKDWCAMQPPVFDLDGNVYPTCVENASGHRNDDGTCTFETDRGPVIYSGGKCDLCRMGPAAVCSCTDAGCEAISNSPVNYEFVLTEEDGVPTLTAPSSNNNNTQFRLQRVD